MVTIAVTLGLGLGYDPVGAFVMVGTGPRHRAGGHLHPDERLLHRLLLPRAGGLKPGLLSHLVIPVLGITAFVPAWLTAAGIEVFSFVAPLTPPNSYMGPRGRWMIIGVIYLIFLYRTAPERVTEVGLVHLDQLEEDQQ